MSLLWMNPPKKNLHEKVWEPLSYLTGKLDGIEEKLLFD